MRGKFISGYLTDNKHMPAWIVMLVFILLWTCCLTLDLSGSERNNWVIVKANPASKQSLVTQLKKQNFTLIYEITPSTSIYEYSNNYMGIKNPRDALQSVLITFSNEILEAEVVRIYEDSIKPWEAFEQASTGTSLYMSYLDLDNYYGNDVSKVWSRGLSGNGVTVAVPGVGIETKLLDLQRNIDSSLCFNFVSNKSDVTPEIFTSAQKKALQFTDYGNRIVSVLAAEKDNNFCGAGISYNSNVVGIKIFAIWKGSGSPLVPAPIHWTASDIISRALVHKLDEIDIFVNAWTPTSPFDPLDLATREAIAYSATTGRHGLGTVHVVPAGQAGNLLSNNIHTITVGMLGVNGTIQSGAVVDASVLTSGLGYGSNLTSSYLVTSSHRNKCITGFKGYSAAESYVSGIVALGLEANPNLSLRDIQDILVKSSDHTGLQASASFKRNAAGHYFHEMLGFGLLNAEKFVSFSGTRKPASPLLFRTVLSSEIRTINGFTKELKFCFTCDITKDPDCLTTIEHLVISVDFNTTSDIFKLEMMSPSGTRSVLMDMKLNQVDTQTNRKAKLVSVHFWNEVAFGSWTLTIQTTQSTDQIHIGPTSLTLYGTRNETLAENEHGLVTHVCGNDKSTSTVRMPYVSVSQSHSPTKVPKPDKEDKPNITLFIVLPVGVIAMCGIMLFIIMRGNSPGPISSYGAPKKKKTTRKRVNDTMLHRQISLLRERSRQDSTSEDVEGEMAE